MRKIGALSVSASLALGLLAGTSVIANAIPEGDEPTNPPSMEENVGAESDSVADEGTGDPIYGDSSREDAAVTPFALNSSALTVLETWRPALTANSATAAYVDSAADRVYQASRSESPALLFSNSLSASGVTQTTTLPDTTGSWDMTMNGSYLAVGTNGNGVNRPRVAIFDASAPLNKPLRTAVLPTSSSASAYAMSLAPDYTAKDLVWVGTYDPRGAHLYSLNLETGEFTDFTPGTQWQKADIKYVRSVTTTPEGVIVGLGNPGSVWFLANDASQPVEVEGALGGIEVSIVYSLATSPALDEGERPLDPPEQEDPASEQETAMSGQESDRPTGANIATTPP